MSQHINICWDFFLSILFEFPSCNNLSKLSNSFSITKKHWHVSLCFCISGTKQNADMSVSFLHFRNLCIFASGNRWHVSLNSCISKTEYLTNPSVGDICLCISQLEESIKANILKKNIFCITINQRQYHYISFCYKKHIIWNTSQILIDINIFIL